MSNLNGTIQQLNNLIDDTYLLNKFYPVGSIKLTLNDINPLTYLGGGMD